MTELEKIDELRQRMRLSYSEAKLALDAAGGDVIQTLITLEREAMTSRDQLLYRGRETWQMMKEGVLKASKARIKLKRGGKILFTLPAPVGALGLVGALASTQIAVAGLAGTALALAKRCTLEVDSTSSPESEFDRSSNVDL